jgi:hypothetical protein
VIPMVCAMPANPGELSRLDPWQATYSPRPWDSSDAQRLFGLALMKTGQKFKDRAERELWSP